MTIKWSEFTSVMLTVLVAGEPFKVTETTEQVNWEFTVGETVKE